MSSALVPEHLQVKSARNIYGKINIIHARRTEEGDAYVFPTPWRKTFLCYAPSVKLPCIPSIPLFFQIPEPSDTFSTALCLPYFLSISGLQAHLQESHITFPPRISSFFLLYCHFADCVCEFHLLFSFPPFPFSGDSPTNRPRKSWNWAADIFLRSIKEIIWP